MKTASGLEYIEVEPGTGTQAEAGKTVSARAAAYPKPEEIEVASILVDQILAG